MLLYVHVPFCRKKCEYCAFHSVPLDMELVETWLAAVCDEAALWGRRLKRPEPRTLFFGGGTPSLLPPWAWDKLMLALGDAFRLGGPGFEMSVEANPDSCSAEFLERMRDFGVTRLSLGVQSFRDDDLRALGRPHTARQAKAAFEAARWAGYGNIGLDLIWGLPGQRLKLWMDNLKQAVELGPEHLSCYSLTIEPRTGLALTAMERDLKLPDDDEQSRMFMHGSDYLEEQGYLQYEVSNYARMGYQCLHNQGYWEGEDYLGLGSGAVSTLFGRRWENPKDFAAWAAQVRDRGVGRQAEELDPDTRVDELVMLGLRTSRGLDLRRYKELSGEGFVARHRELLGLLRTKDLVRITKDYVRLTRSGMLVSNAILERLLRGSGKRPGVLPPGGSRC